MKSGFAPTQLEDYVEKHLGSNQGVKRGDLYRRLKHAMEAARTITWLKANPAKRSS